MEKTEKRFGSVVARPVAELVCAGALKVARGSGVPCRSLMPAIVSAVMALALLAGCGGPPLGDTGSAPALERRADTSASATGTLIVGFDQAYPPYGYVGDDGEYAGFDLDLARAVAERLDWELQLEPIDWDAKDALLKSGAINCIWNGFTMEGREDDYAFSDPYMFNAQVVVVRDDSGISGCSDLAGKTVVTQLDSAAEKVFAEDASDLAATFASLETIGEYNTAFMQLESGAVDAVACDLSVARYQMAANPGAYLMLAEYLAEENYAVGFKKGDDTTAEKVTETLQALYEDGTVGRIAAEYADLGLSMENWQVK